MTAPRDPLMECVPNVSEGRRPDVVAGVRAAVESTAGCCLLDVHSDPDHNRSVITFAGAPAAVEAGAVALAAAAVALIDMRRQDGVHPRMGAVDVVPFVPLAGMEMAECLAVAERTGRRIADELSLPVYLYGASARPGRPKRLAELRDGGFEGLRGAGRLPLEPDFGPLVAHSSAGAAAVGCRAPLVAFNLLLDTPDPHLARRVASLVRESSGGLPGVQALGLLLPGRGRTQVSMNLVDPGPAAIREVVEAVRNAAASAGTRVTGAELVGLAPAAVLAGLEDCDLPGMPTAADAIEARLERCAG